MSRDVTWPWLDTKDFAIETVVALTVHGLMLHFIFFFVCLFLWCDSVVGWCVDVSCWLTKNSHRLWTEHKQPGPEYYVIIITQSQLHWMATIYAEVTWVSLLEIYGSHFCHRWRSARFVSQLLYVGRLLPVTGESASNLQLLHSLWCFE